MWPAGLACAVRRCRLSIAREQQQFPTRNYPYRARAAHQAAAPDGVALQPESLYRRVGGLDLAPRPMTAAELEGLDDPFGRLLAIRPAVSAFGAQRAGGDRWLAGAGRAARSTGLSRRRRRPRPWTPETDRLQRGFRFAIARGRGEFTAAHVGSSTPRFDRERGVPAGHRLGRRARGIPLLRAPAGTFFWAGMSHHALEDATRGKGPFDSHVNGSLVMKELRPPWVHWHAPQAGINEEALAPDDPLRDEPLFTHRVTAERLETEVVRPGDPPLERGAGAQGGRRRTASGGNVHALPAAGGHRHHRQSGHLRDGEPSAERRRLAAPAAFVLPQPRHPVRHARARAR